MADPRRFAPLAAVALLALAAGAVVGARHVPSQQRVARSFATAWERGDYRAMHALLSAAARRRTSPAALERAYRNAATVLTLTRVRAGRPAAAPDGAVALPVTLETRIFGRLSGRVVLSMGDRGDGQPGVDWGPRLVAPGLRPGERLSRETRLPPRATLDARDGSALARGPGRVSDIGPAAADIVGSIGSAPPDRAALLAARGFPPNAVVGRTGLEREFDDRLAGTPGGTLLEGGRVVATSTPRPGRAVRTTIDPAVQRATVTALAGRFGGVAAVRPRDGQVLGLAGIAFSAPQPPGSTFKIVTLAGVLRYRIARPTDRFPVQTQALLAGVPLQNANGEACGGALETAFAESCNSVFAPLGAKLGARRLVATAERFGFNEDPRISGAAPSTIPPANTIGDDLAVGSSAIGQGKVQATPLEMAIVAATIGERGRRAEPTLLLHGPPRPPRRATSPAVARTIGRFMRAVVTSGTGAGAAVPGVAVAGKTGTAELRSTVPPTSSSQAQQPPPPQPNDISDTDAWFTAYAPARHPRVAVCVLLVGQGAGGATAAPAARTVIEAALGRA